MQRIGVTVDLGKRLHAPGHRDVCRGGLCPGRGTVRAHGVAVVHDRAIGEDEAIVVESAAQQLRQHLATEARADLLERAVDPRNAKASRRLGSSLDRRSLPACVCRLVRCCGSTINDGESADSIAYRFLQLDILLGGPRCEQLLRVKLSDVSEYDKTITLWDGKGLRARPRKHALPLSELAWQEVQSLIEIATRASSH